MPSNPNPTSSSLAEEPESSKDVIFVWRASSIPTYDDIRKLFELGAQAIEKRARMSHSDAERKRLGLIEAGSARMAELMGYSGRPQ